MDLEQLKQMIRNKEMAKFVRFQYGMFWYTTQGGFEFPVPLEDIGTAELRAEDKVLFFMRWINKQRDVVAQAQQANT
jgi:hypothetical protein